MQHPLCVAVQDGTVNGHSVWLTWKNQQVKAVILARSSDWYAYSLNCTERFRHELHVVVCGTHDSCLDRPVLALDSMRWYAPLEMRIKSLEPQPPRENATGPIDAFDRRRKSHYGHNMLIGALMCGRTDALKRLATLRPSTRLRIEAEVRALHMRRRGRPLKV